VEKGMIRMLIVVIRIDIRFEGIAMKESKERTTMERKSMEKKVDTNTNRASCGRRPGGMLE
jgi:hypothetical protein